MITRKVTKERLKELAARSFGDMVKAVVDVDKEVMAVGGEMHADAEKELLSRGSSQNDLWGINIYPHKDRGDMIAFESLINIRPTVGNLGIEVEDGGLRDRITGIVNRLTR